MNGYFSDTSIFARHVRQASGPLLLPPTAFGMAENLPETAFRKQTAYLCPPLGVLTGAYFVVQAGEVRLPSAQKRIKG